MRLLHLPFYLLLALLFLIPNYSFGQGVTTSSMNGRITDTNGEPLIGANVLAVHTPTGTIYGNITNIDGYFRISNMRVGGPYKVTVSYTGFADKVEENVYLRLGQVFQLNEELSDNVEELGTVTVIAGRDIFDGNRTGAETTITEAQISTLPTVARAIGDFARLTPQATITEGSDGFSISLAGQNNRYNAIYIDGAVNNDVFGLAGSGTNGGQTGVSPFSVDAIEEFQVQLAPFDVRIGGFSGGAINAITRSGSNNIEGSAYFYFRNQALTRSNLEGAEINNFSAWTAGARVGGPIIKDKLFYFINYERQDETIPLPFDANDYTGDTDIAGITNLANFISETYGYDVGTYTDNATTLISDKITFKLDLNINRNNKLSFRHGFVRADNIEGRQSSSRDVDFQNGTEAFISNTNTTSIELNSVIGVKYANNLKIGYTRVRDDRDGLGPEFPYVEIEDGPGSIFFGWEQFSTANALDQDIFTFTDNFEIYTGKHNITIGTHNEFYDVYNLFVPQNFGVYTFGSVNDFLMGEDPIDYIRSFSLQQQDIARNTVGDGMVAAAAFNSGQIGFYVQDEFQALDNLKISMGLRVDVPFFQETPTNTDFNNNALPLIAGFYPEILDSDGSYRAQTGEFIKTQLLWSPRIGFNLDVTGEKKTQIRGGIGIFTSRVPLVWPGGAYNNNGINRGTQFGWPAEAAGMGFIPDYTAQPPFNLDPNDIAPSGDIDLFDKDFKIPQVFKANIAVDQKLPWGMIGNADFLYTKTINNVRYRNINLKPSQVSIDGTGDNRLLYDRRDEITDVLRPNSFYGRVLYADNTSLGYTYNLTFSLSKPFSNGFTGSVAYSFGDAFALFEGTSSQNSSQWRGAHNVNGRNVDAKFGRSDFAGGSRFIANVSYAIDWAKDNTFSPKTTIALFWESQQGRPYSYIYNDGGRLNNEDSREYSLIYVPAFRDDIVLIDDGAVTADQQWTMLNAFIESDDHLSSRRGTYAEKNASRAPWSHVLDLKFLQDFTLNKGGKSHTLQLTLDVFNFTNLISSSWGRRPLVGSFNNFELLNFEGFIDDGMGNENIPTFTFEGVENNDPSFNRFDDSGIQSSRWQMQLGVRYIFK